MVLRVSNQTIEFQLLWWYACAIRARTRCHSAQASLLSKSKRSLCTSVRISIIFTCRIVRSRERRHTNRVRLCLLWTWRPSARTSPCEPPCRVEESPLAGCYHVSWMYCCAFVSEEEDNDERRSAVQVKVIPQGGELPLARGRNFPCWQKGRALKNIFVFFWCLLLWIVVLIVVQLALIRRTLLRTMFL